MAESTTNPTDDTGFLRAEAAVNSLFRVDRAAHALGIELIDVAPGHVRLAMTVRSDMVNGFGMCHGGVVFTLADTAFAFACNSYGEAMVAAGASIEFVAPTPNGERVIATARSISNTERHGIYDVLVTKTSGEILAHFRGRCSRLRRPTSQSIEESS